MHTEERTAYALVYRLASGPGRGAWTHYRTTAGARTACTGAFELPILVGNYRISLILDGN